MRENYPQYVQDVVDGKKSFLDGFWDYLDEQREARDAQKEPLTPKQVAKQRLKKKLFSFEATKDDWHGMQHILHDAAVAAGAEPGTELYDYALKQGFLAYQLGMILGGEFGEHPRIVLNHAHKSAEKRVAQVVAEGIPQPEQMTYEPENLH
ncbi:MAG: hypothetical protein FWE31_00360 [Firmicutes bacterium]|nr:hypothetical protein [Bacillota bacterium]